MKSPQEILKKIRRIELKAEQHVQDVLAGAYHSAFKGRGMEFEDVRGYQPGDEIRNIDWNVTARMQYPFVKNFREEREMTVLLLVDVSASSMFGTTKNSKEQYIAEIGSLIAFSAIKNNDKVGLMLFSDHVEKYLPPQKGVKHVLRVIREILVNKRKKSQTDIKEALNYLGKIQKRKCVIFLISDFFAAPFKEELATLSKKHEIIGINVKDPKEHFLPNVGLIQLKDLETGQTKIIDTASKRVRDLFSKKQKEKESKIAQIFQSAGRGFINISCDADYYLEIRRFFESRRKRA